MNRTILDDDQVALARSLWAAGKTRDEIAYAVGVSIDTLSRRFQDQLGDLPSRDRRVNSGRRGIDPSPEEIMAATAEIRAGWPDERFLPEPTKDLRFTAF